MNVACAEYDAVSLLQILWQYVVVLATLQRLLPEVVVHSLAVRHTGVASVLSAALRVVFLASLQFAFLQKDHVAWVDIPSCHGLGRKRAHGVNDKPAIALARLVAV